MCQSVMSTRSVWDERPRALWKIAFCSHLHHSTAIISQMTISIWAVDLRQIEKSIKLIDSFFVNEFISFGKLIAVANENT